MTTYKIWGPKLWHFIHYLQPNNDSDFIIFMFKLSNIIPCKKCKKHMKEIIYYGYKSISPLKKKIYDNDLFLKWTYDFHDCVNKFRDVKSPTFDIVQKKYKNRNNIDMNRLFYDYYYSIINVYEIKKNIDIINTDIMYIINNLRKY